VIITSVAKAWLGSRLRRYGQSPRANYSKVFRSTSTELTIVRVRLHRSGVGIGLETGQKKKMLRGYQKLVTTCPSLTRLFLWISPLSRQPKIVTWPSDAYLRLEP
jgi:hypothetical protein